MVPLLTELSVHTVSLYLAVFFTGLIYFPPDSWFIGSGKFWTQINPPKKIKEKAGSFPSSKTAFVEYCFSVISPQISEASNHKVFWVNKVLYFSLQTTNLLSSTWSSGKKSKLSLPIFVLYSSQKKLTLGKCGRFQTIKPWANSVHIYQPWRWMATLVFPHAGSCHTSGEVLPPKLNSWWEVLEERNEKETKKDWAPISIKLIQLKINMAKLNCCPTLCGRRFRFIAVVNSDQKATGYWHFNQGASDRHISMCAHPGKHTLTNTSLPRPLSTPE